MTFDDEFERRLAQRLDPLDRLGGSIMNGDLDLADYEFEPGRDFTPAAVLVPVVRRPEGLTVLLTQRTADMPTHAGQVAFPGGKLHADDSGPVAAALRETLEECGLDPRFVTPLGGFGDYRTGTYFQITPVVAYVEPGFSLTPDPREVDAVFETPVSFLMDAANHQRHAREYRGVRREYYAMPFGDRYIWGVTAGMIRALWRRLYGDDAP